MSISHRFRRARWLAVCCATLLAVTLAPPAAVPARAEPGKVPIAVAGADPQQRPVPADASRDAAVAPDQRPPVVPIAVRSGDEPHKLTKRQWARVPKPGAARAAAAADEVFVDLLLRPGFVLGDTSLVTYFNLRNDDTSWQSWRVALFDAASGTEQASTSLTKDDLAAGVCRTPRTYCRSFGEADGWVLDPAKTYFITITAIFADGTEVGSAPSEQAKPRKTIVPPAISNGQAAGCGCGSALGTTDASQAVRAIGVNTGTGAFSRVERDLTMASFGVPFASIRTYSSANPGSGKFGPGWAWAYDMRVTAAEDGAVVRADDGAEALYRLVNGAYVRPAGLRSNLRRSGEGWELVTYRQIVYGFDAQGRLTSIVNPREVGVKVVYAGTGMTVTDASGRVVTVKQDAGLIRSITLPDGRRVSYEYTNGLLTKVKDARDETWKYRYTPGGQLSQVVNPADVVELANEYDASGRIGRQTDALGKATAFAWDAAKQEAKTTDADGVVVWDGYRGNVLIYSQRGNGDTNNHRYDGTLNRSLVVNGNQNQHESTYDVAGNRVEQFAPQPLKFTEQTKYDARNNPIEHVDANGGKWIDRYNEFDELIESEDAEHHKIEYTYDSRGLLATVTDQRKKVTRYENIADGKPNAGLPAAVVSPEGRRVEYGYDKTGRRTSVVDPRGTVGGAKPSHFTTRYVYDEQDRTVETWNPGKRKPFTSAYDEVGRLERTTTPTGVTTHQSYFANGLLKAAADERKTILYTYTAAGRRASVKVDMRHEPDLVTTYSYNAKGLVHGVTEPRGNVPGANAADHTTTYVYDANDNPIQIRRPCPGGKVVTRDINVDALDRTTDKTDEFGKKSSFERANTGEVKSIKDNLGRATSMDYDANGRQTGITDAKGGSVTFEYDAAGNEIKSVSATGGVTTSEYDGDGLLISTTEPRGNVPGADKERFTSHTEYDAAGNPVRTVDAMGHVTSYTYDANGRLVATTDAKKRTTHYTFDEDDRMRTVTTPEVRFDPDDPEEDATVYSYADDGMLASVRDPKGHRTKLDYDEAGRLIRSTDPLGRRTEAAYDADNNRIATITLDEDEEDDDLSAKERAKRTIVDTYDIVGRREKRTLGTGGPVYTWGYDAKDRTTSYGDPTGVRNVVYDDEDQILSVTRKEADRKDEVFAYGYDERGNITSRQYPDGTEVNVGYDADSQLTSLTAQGGTAGATAATWKFGYDVAGRRVSTTLPTPTGLVEKRGYDDAGRLTRIGTERVGAAAPAAATGKARASDDDPDAPGAPRDVHAQPGAGLAAVSWQPPKDSGDSDVSSYTVTASPGGLTTTVDARTTTAVMNGLEAGTAYTFTVTATNRDGTGPASQASEAVTPVALPQDPVSNFQLTLDEVGNPTRVVTTRGGVSESVAYAYDKVDRVTSACYAVASCTDKATPTGRIDYDYDLVGNRTSQKRSGSVGDDITTYEYDDADELVEETVKSKHHSRKTEYGYDVNGNQTRAGGDRFAYNLDRSLAQATVSGRTTTFQYDATGLRLASTSTAQNQPTTTQRWTWDVAGTLPQIAADTVTDGAGNTLERRGFTYGPDDEPLALLDPAGGAHPYTHDWLGGVANMLTPTGTPEKGYDYDPFGNPRVGDTLKAPAAAALAEGPGLENPMQFTGAYQDSTSGNGNYYLRARNYNPGTGRFATRDPMPTGESSVSAYTYAENNPVAYTDPTGQVPEAGATTDGAVVDPGPSPEDVAKAQQLQSKSTLDVILEAGGQILMEFLGINDIINCLKGDLVACVSMIVGALPWGKIFKAKKIAEAIFRAGKAVITFFEEIKWARAIIRGAEKAAEAAKAAAATAAKAAAEKAAAAKAAAEAAARKAADQAAERAKALAAKAKAATKKAVDDVKEGLTGCTRRKHSFIAGTAVLLADGSTKPIERVEPGDTVVTTDPVTGLTESRQVTRGIRTDDDKDFVDLTIKDTDGKHTLTTTEHHPFWSQTRQRWVDAGDLKTGELLRTSAGTHVQIGAIRQYRGEARTYDLTVDNLHTYYVLAGDTSVLVHNCGDRTHDKARGAAGVSEMTDTLTRMYPNRMIHSETRDGPFEIHTPHGVRQVDIALEDGKGGYILFEVKVNKSNYTRTQRRKDKWIQDNLGWPTIVVRRSTPCPICNPWTP
jgi:RHS repeat-associated protein